MLEQLSSGVIPLSMCSATVTLGHTMSGWNLSDAIFDAQPTPRTFVYDVIFDKPFSSIPVVQATLCGFDIDNRVSGRVSIRVDAITPGGFTLEISTWERSMVYSVDVSWLAIGS